MDKDTEEPREIELVAEQSTVALLTKSEIDTQITTAKKYPRSLKRFRDEALQMVTLNEEIAEACIYSLPRDGKTIEGPSARFAEIMVSAWGNCRAGARVVNEGDQFITAQGVFHDLERNTAITYEVQRRITNSKGVRFKTDMIGVTGNAASSIALRNAILKGIPKAFWAPMYQAARKTVMGDFETLANRRAAALKAFLAYGVKPEKICATLGVAGVEDIGLEQLVTLRGILTAIKEGDTTPEQAFSDPDIKRPQPANAPASETTATTTASNAAQEAHVQQQAPAAADAITSGPGAAVISEASLRVLNKHLNELYPDSFPSAFCAYFKIETPEMLPASQMNAAVNWLVEQRKAAAKA